MAETRIGISGWRYGPWRGTFYPKKLPQKRELEYASRQLNTVEINGSFYSLQRPESYRQWHAQTPEDFVFAVKGGRFITHMKKLKDVRTPLANFVASGVLCLKEKLGPVLWQFPPGFALNLERFDEFFSMLPRDTEQAAELAKAHDERLKGRSWTRTDRKRRIRHAVEVRHNSFKDPAFIKLLRKHKVALVFADTAGRWPYAEDITSDFVYARLHGDKELYVSGYSDEALNWWAARLDAWRGGGEPPDPNRVSGAASVRKRPRDVFVYFDNDVKVCAPFDAISLARRLGCAPATCDAVRGGGGGAVAVGELPRDRWPGIGRPSRTR